MNILSFIFGFLAASAALLAQAICSFVLSLPLAGPLPVTLVLGAAAIEEGARFAFLVQLSRRSHLSLALPQALFFALGFIMVEVLLILFSNATMIALSPIITIALVHLITTLIVYTGLRSREKFATAPLAAFLVAVLIHTLYNASR